MVVTPVELRLPTKPFDPAAVVRPSLRSTHAYTPATIPEHRAARVIKLDMNESPYGPSPKTRDAIAAFTATNRYPDFEQIGLREAIGHYVERDPETIICGAGLDDVLNTLMHAVLEPGAEVIISEPTFGVYRMLISLYDAVAVNVPLDASFQLRPEGILNAITERTKCIIICTPNNPTGNPIDRGAIERVAGEAPCLVAIDEAYAEFAGESLIDLLDRFENVAIFRTMSKFAGLAGMRVGYGVFPKRLMPYLAPVIPAFHNVSMISRVAAIAALDDFDYLEGIVRTIIRDRETLAANLSELPGVETMPSQTNFLLVRLPVVDAMPVITELANRGIFVRSFPNPVLGLERFLRVTIGTPEENDAFVRELASILDARSASA
jgi:histidinol-phosphate aminotransferase